MRGVRVCSLLALLMKQLPGEKTINYTTWNINYIYEMPPTSSSMSHDRRSSERLGRGCPLSPRRWRLWLDQHEHLPDQKGLPRGGKVSEPGSLERRPDPDRHLRP